VLGHAQVQRRQVEHLPGLDPDHRRTRQVGAAPTAPVRAMLDHLVGGGDLGQVGAWGAGLLAGPAPLCPLVGPALGPRRLTQAVRGRRLGGVGGVLAEPTLQLHDPGLERGIGRLQLADRSRQHAVGRAQLADDCGLHRDGRFQIGVGGRDRGLQDTKRSSPPAHGPCGRATPKAPENQLGRRQRRAQLR
jgi:hypothetical protein